MPSEPLSQLTLKKFTAFENLDLKFSPGINVFIGRNSTGKTHILKVLYAATRSREKTGEGSFGQKLVGVFAPLDKSPARLVHRSRGGATAEVCLRAKNKWIKATFTTKSRSYENIKVQRSTGYIEVPMVPAYIPVKEMLAHAPGFRSLYATREIAFEDVYADLIDLAYLPLVKGPVPDSRMKLMKQIEKHLPGRVIVEGETFFLRDAQGNLEFSLVAEGLRKIALLWLLVRNGTLTKGNILFWDEPESNLNPALQGLVVDILLRLHREGVQIFLATHNYVLLKEFDLRMKKGDQVMFHTLDRDKDSGSINVQSTTDYLMISPNVIQETYLRLYDEEVKRALGVVGVKH